MEKLLLSVALTFVMFTIPAYAEKPDSPETVEGATTIDAVQAKELFDSEVVFVDTRKDSDWEVGRILGAVQLELKSNFTEENLAKEVGKDEPVVFYCNGIKCPRSSKASAQAVGWGFKKVHYFRLGFPSWKEAGYPVE